VNDDGQDANNTESGYLGQPMIGLSCEKSQLAIDGPMDRPRQHRRDLSDNVVVATGILANDTLTGLDIRQEDVVSQFHRIQLMIQGNMT